MAKAPNSNFEKELKSFKLANWWEKVHIPQSGPLNLRVGGEEEGGLRASSQKNPFPLWFKDAGQWD